MPADNVNATDTGMGKVEMHPINMANDNVNGLPGLSVNDANVLTISIRQIWRLLARHPQVSRPILAMNEIAHLYVV